MSIHHFSLYTESNSYQILGRVIHIEEAQLRFRLVNVLRVRPGDIITLFDNYQSLVIKIEEVGKQHVSGTLLSTHIHHGADQRIDLLLPVFEKDALEFAIEHATIHSVARIQLVTTHMSRSELRPGEYDRLIRIMHAAQEQSKQFVALTIEPPVTLTMAVQRLSSDSIRLLACIQGRPLVSYIDLVAPAVYTILTVGPEGDYTPSEYELLEANGFYPLTMGCSVLRASHAAALLCGLVRTVQCR
jgi:16S rRNA (uracil1498-N3)-methyltransferase